MCAFLIRFLISTAARLLKIRYKSGIDHIELHSNTEKEPELMALFVFVVSGRLTGRFESQHALKVSQTSWGAVVELMLFLLKISQSESRPSWRP